MRRRVLHVIDHTHSGGAQVVIGYILQTLKDRFSFAVAVLGNSGEFSTAYRRLGLPVIELGQRSSRWNPAPVAGLIEIIRRERYDLIHTHLFKSNILGTIAARVLGCKTILHDHTGIYPHSLEYYLPNGLLRYSYLLAYRHALGRCDRAIVPTPATLRNYLRSYPLDPSRITVLPNAIDLRQFNQVDAPHRPTSLRDELRLPAETKLVMMVGRLEPEKDWRTFLEVAREVQRELDHTCAFLVVGSGSEERILRDYARAHALEHVFFLGHRNDVPALLRQADIFLLTSRREVFGIVVLEAMAAGCPVVATRSGGPETIIMAGVDGLLAEVGDVQGLTHQVARLLHDDALGQGLARSARQTVSDRYNLEAMTSRLAGIYTEVLER